MVLDLSTRKARAAVVVFATVTVKANFVLGACELNFNITRLLGPALAKKLFFIFSFFFFFFLVLLLPHESLFFFPPLILHLVNKLARGNN